jgi:hypothetical protein
MAFCCIAKLGEIALHLFQRGVLFFVVMAEKVFSAPKVNIFQFGGLHMLLSKDEAIFVLLIIATASDNAVSIQAFYLSNPWLIGVRLGTSLKLY